MKLQKFDAYLVGVGGQGIGLLAEALVRAADHAGHTVRGVDTHGLAQRGGTVESHLRLGTSAHSPLVSRNQADLVLALERHEALRGAAAYLKRGGTLVYYDAVWQPLAVRLRQEPEATADQVEQLATDNDFTFVRVVLADLADARMQNVALMATLAARGILPDVQPGHYERALADLLAGSTLDANLRLFRSLL